MTTTNAAEFAVSPGGDTAQVSGVTTLAAVRGPRAVTVLDVRPSGQPECEAVADRLCDLGFWPGTEVDVVCSAPFGGAAVYRLRGLRVALRSEEAACVRVVTAST